MPYVDHECKTIVANDKGKRILVEMTELLRGISDADWAIFETIAQACDSKLFSSVNVASNRRSEAIVALWKVLKKLRKEQYQ